MVAFWRKGYGDTSLDDLVAATGASRASLYSLFGDKRSLFQKSLEHYGARFTERIDEELQSPVSGRARMATVLNASADRLTSDEAPPGCLRCNSTLALAGSDETLDQVLAEANQLFLDNLRRLTDRAAENGELSPDEAVRLAVFFTGIVNGMVTLARSGVGREQLAVMIETALLAWPQGKGDK
ncbi:MAG: TetR/AcrR family transcriptional regulator [Geminicoccaceae bacterium]